MVIKESEIRNIVRGLIREAINEKRNLQSPKLFDILKQHGGFENSQNQFPGNWKISKKDAHFRRKPTTGNYSNLSDDDIIGVISSEDLSRLNTDKNIRNFAIENGAQLGGADIVSYSRLSDGSYLLYVDRNANERNSNFDEKNGGWNDYYNKKKERDHNRYSDGKNEFKPTTDRQTAARDLRNNPYFWAKEGYWKDPQNRKAAMEYAKQGLAHNGGPVWRYYNGKAENDKGTYDEQYGNKNLNEAMMDGFSFEQLKGQSFAAKVKYCQQMCGRQIGGGSSRIVFQIDDQWCLKLARNQKGIAQNEEEFRIATDGYGTSLSVNVDPNRSDTDGFEWIVSEYVLPAKPQDFKHCYGIEWKDVAEFAQRLGVNRDVSYMYDKYEDNDNVIDFLNELHDYWANWDGAMGDCARIVNWGLTNRNGTPDLVLLDTGASMDIIRQYYCRR